jgi:glycosyltransferase involved in cell wall biosynthesis
VAVHIRRMLTDLLGQGIEAVVIDHQSTDETLAICQEFLGKGLLSIRHLNWEGCFSLTEQLQAKASISDEYSHEWIIHIDADECLQSPHEGETLIEGISRHAANGYDVINFEEFVFLPVSQESVETETSAINSLHYYLYAPKGGESRLMRAWRNSKRVSNVASAGHLLSGEPYRLAPERFILRHYMVLSQQHAQVKYVERQYKAEELERGWHANRRNLKPALLRMPDKAKLKKLPNWKAREFDRSQPMDKHFWAW